MSDFQIEAVLRYMQRVEPLTWIFQSTEYGLSMTYATLEVAG